MQQEEFRLSRLLAAALHRTEQQEALLSRP